ncbi:hypothetical protein [Mucilaginibacter hurinus]|uniref:hypothetical protein n=1 Tax=Mucilaginibacter hurinus TaxID=2201324 RepID=UPI0011BEB9C1|nr:hypothetical protein [Mucilaginibacter hurinus]
MKKSFFIAMALIAMIYTACSGGAGNQQNQTGSPTGESAYDTADSTHMDTTVITDTSGHVGQP